jgi:hypothetical protein
MAGIIENLINNLLEKGFFDILGFALVTAIFYGLLKKTKVLGESVVINGVVSIVAGFFIFGAPVLAGYKPLIYALSAFFTQATMWLLMFLLAFLAAAFFYPNMAEWLPKVIFRRTMLWVMLGLAFGLLVMSGFISVLWETMVTPLGSPSTKEPGPAQDTYILVAGLIVFVILIIIAASTVRMEG